MEQLEGRVAVVTGAASGIGLALSKRFAGAGMKVVMADIEQDALDTAAESVRAGGAEVASLVTDVRREEQVEALSELAYSRFGAVHLLCNNAGVQNRDRPTWEHRMDDWRWVFDVNVYGVVHGMRAFVPRMLAGGDEGHIVNTASIAGLVTGAPGASVYYASKHAVISLSESLYRELTIGETRLSASVLCPGAVTTNIFSSERNRPDEYGAAEGVMPQSRAVSDPGSSYPPEYVAQMVEEGVRANRFYIFAAQDDLLGYVKMGVDRMLEGRNPAVPRRRPQA